MTPIPLSPIDHVFTGKGSYPIEFVFAYDGRIDGRTLSHSLESAFQRFPPARSRLVRTSEYSYGLEPNADGARFEVVESSRTFDDIQHRHEFLNPVDTREGEPLTSIRLTQTPSGSVLGVSMSHAVVDGFSYFYFLSSWARLFHGLDVAATPSHERQLLMPTDLDSKKRITPDDVLQDSGIFWDEGRPSIARDKLLWEGRHFSKQKLGDLLADARKEVDVRLSYNDVLTAYLCRHYLAEWNRTAGQAKAFVSCPVDFRRILPGFPRTYFGCAVCLRTLQVDEVSLTEGSAVDLATAIRSAVASVDETYVRGGLRILEALREQEGLSVVEASHVIHPRSGLLVTNLSRLPVQELEFNAGPPTAFDIFTPAQRGAVVLPAKDGLDVRLCLPQPRA